MLSENHAEEILSTILHTFKILENDLYKFSHCNQSDIEHSERRMEQLDMTQVIMIADFTPFISLRSRRLIA